ncbi:GrpB family protein [Micromonospora sp. NBC_00362]|uniref:GrpB family protein n=1 Tax=Micromonospora sp. NBC_00362 TaxID=2975975 RepID=UPI002251533B|nr:GrpB family protein [Micromonospora sp. NBC_00362]MCX5121210.1 GrpB family protein [Micromonospora sp. NBC_00362]
MAEYPQDVVQRFHGTPDQVDAGLVGEPPRTWESVVIEDTAQEDAYLPALERLGYRLVLREPWWHGHRMLLSPAEDVNLHVWPQGAPEPIRHRLFRDWLRAHPHDRERYAATKRRLARDNAHRPRDYSLAKNDVIDEIYARIFAA